VTDGLSRAAVDDIMIEIAQRLQNLDAAFVARVESDEFACAFEGDVSDAQLGKTIFGVFDEPFASGEDEIFIPISLGIAHARTMEEAREVVRNADLAMYRTKRGSRGDTSLISELHRAYREGEFTLFYQPIVRMDGGSSVVGVEALLRWEHPHLGLLEPAAFLETLESLRLSEQIGAWVIDEAFRQMRAWSDRGVELQVWVNLFPRQAFDPTLGAQVTKAAERHGTSHKRLVVEIIESVVAGFGNQLVDNVRLLRAYGVRTAIDDFGTGHSSLGRLREIPADFIKIDRSFINRSEEDAKARAVIAAVFQLASELHFTPLAEGVENEAQLRLLRDRGCEYFQGFHIGRPMRASELEQWVAAGLQPQ